MAIIIRKVQSFRKDREYQCGVCKITRDGVCLMFMWLKFGSLKTRILEVNRGNMHLLHMFQDIQITRQLF